MFSTKFIATLATLATLAASAVASGVEMRGDIGFFKAPMANEVWKVGTTQTVQWRLSFEPSPDAEDGKLYLSYVGEDVGGDHHTTNKPIADGITLNAGSVDIPVPNVKPGDQYRLTLYSGESAITKPSEAFAITQQ